MEQVQLEEEEAERKRKEHEEKGAEGNYGPGDLSILRDSQMMDSKREKVTIQRVDGESLRNLRRKRKEMMTSQSYSCLGMRMLMQVVSYCKVINILNAESSMKSAFSRA